MGSNPLGSVDPTGLMPPQVWFGLFGAIGGGVSNGFNYYSQDKGFWKGALAGAIAGGTAGFLIPSAAVGGAVGGVSTQLLNRYGFDVKIFDSGDASADCIKEIVFTAGVGSIFGKSFDKVAKGVTAGSTNVFIKEHINIIQNGITNAYTTSYTNIANAYANFGSAMK